MAELILGILIGIAIMAIFGGITSYRSNKEWFEHYNQLIEDNHKFNQQVNDSWYDFCTKMIQRLTEEKETNMNGEIHNDD